MVQQVLRTIWQFLMKLSIELPYKSSMVLLGIFTREMKTYVHTKTCSEIVYQFYL